MGTKYAKLLNERILASKSIAERRQEREEAERERLEEIERKIKLRNEFFNVDQPKVEKIDLIEMGMTSATFNEGIIRNTHFCGQIIGKKL